MSANNEFGFVSYVAPVKENPYDKIVKAMIDAGEDVAYPLTCAAKDAGKERFKFSGAATDNNRTARLRETSEPDKKGNVTMLFTLTTKRKTGPRAKRGSKSE